MAQKLYYFNPTAEMAIRNGNRSYRPPRLLATFENDLACLPFAIGSGNDAVFVPHQPSPEFLHRLGAIYSNESLIGRRTRFVTPQDLAAQSSRYSLVPWSNSPSLSSLSSQVRMSSGSVANRNEKNQLETIIDFPVWDTSFKKRYQRNTILPLYNAIRKRGAINLPPKPCYCTSMAEVEAAVTEYKNAVIKLNYSSSGRGVFFVSEIIDAEYYRQIANAIADGAIVEPWYAKYLDLSLQLSVAHGSAQYIGFSQMINDAKGRYLGSVLNPAELVYNGNTINLENMLEPIHKALSVTLPESDYCKNYEGPLGVDVLLYEANGDLQIHPLVEVNVRHTMGLVALALSELVLEEMTAHFYIRKVTPELLAKFETPPVISDGKIAHGCLPLTDWMNAKQFVAYIAVE